MCACFNSSLGIVSLKKRELVALLAFCRSCGSLFSGSLTDGTVDWSVIVAVFIYLFIYFNYWDEFLIYIITLCLGLHVVDDLFKP